MFVIINTDVRVGVSMFSHTISHFSFSDSLFLAIKRETK